MTVTDVSHTPSSTMPAAPPANTTTTTSNATGQNLIGRNGASCPVGMPVVRRFDHLGPNKCMLVSVTNRSTNRTRP
ncbi:hypothetical protein Rhe02_14670 [Rhizocola hellebori]|uniref:Uncharacterized protein n=1 Tax=Rhizocola hellebori TaxID=1392758 RepID=A0A8J3VEB8_9ACTN|nr:hypothetical protein Rhe02_14670 [Rhizocola hellebori]